MVGYEAAERVEGAQAALTETPRPVIDVHLDTMHPSPGDCPPQPRKTVRLGSNTYLFY